MSDLLPFDGDPECRECHERVPGALAAVWAAGEVIYARFDHCGTRHVMVVEPWQADLMLTKGADVLVGEPRPGWPQTPSGGR